MPAHRSLRIAAPSLPSDLGADLGGDLVGDTLMPCRRSVPIACRHLFPGVRLRQERVHVVVTNGSAFGDDPLGDRGDLTPRARPDRAHEDVRVWTARP